MPNPNLARRYADALPDLLWILSADGTPVYQNRASREFLGRSVEQLHDFGISTIAHPDDHEQLRRIWAHAYSTGEPVDVEFRCRRSDGSYRRLWCRAASVPSGTDDGKHWVASLSDVHRHHILEAELDAALRNRDEFLSMLAHELRGPLQTLRQSLTLLESPAVADEVRGKLHSAMDRQLTLLTRIAEELRDFHTLRWNAMTLKPANITLRQLVDSIETVARSTMEKAGVQFSCEVSEPLCDMLIDAERVTQAVMNLLSNAAKYSEHGGRVELNVTCEQGDALFAVQDWGCGIDAARLDEIFGLFVRAPSPGSAMREGLGVGLAVARHIAEMHGGTIEAHSEGLGKGARFVLRIPLSAMPRRFVES
jgi:PAS domain S-box-containing protein